MEDFYKALGVSRTALPSEIQKKYRETVKKLHPDQNVGNEDTENKLREINAAYSVIGNINKRREYDKKLDQEARAERNRQQNPEGKKQPEQKRQTGNESTSDTPFGRSWGEFMGSETMHERAQRIARQNAEQRQTQTRINIEKKKEEKTEQSAQEHQRFEKAAQNNLSIQELKRRSSESGSTKLSDLIKRKGITESGHRIAGSNLGSDDDEPENEIRRKPGILGSDDDPEGFNPSGENKG